MLYHLLFFKKNSNCHSQWNLLNFNCGWSDIVLVACGTLIAYATFLFSQRSDVFDALWRWTRALPFCDLYAFVAGSSKINNVNPKVRLLNEYCRLLGKGSFHFSSGSLDDMVSLSNDLWRISGVNSSYAMCSTYPFSLIVPKCIR